MRATVKALQDTTREIFENRSLRTLEEPNGDGESRIVYSPLSGIKKSALTPKHRTKVRTEQCRAELLTPLGHQKIRPNAQTSHQSPH